MSGWLLERIAIEGFRGINNEGDPLVLDFTPEAVNSVSAPNGVGKSSIFDALAYAIRGKISKLDDLPAAESGAAYYVNRFHSRAEGTISLTVKPIAAGPSLTVTVKRAVAGTRVVTSPPGVDGNALLASLDRDFVLLDHKTLQTFMDHKALERGRSFAGLLGLAKYSKLRQELEALANTRAFNRHLGTHDLDARQTTLLGSIRRKKTEAATAFHALTQTPLADQTNHSAAITAAHNALHQMAIIRDHTEGKAFKDVSIDDCVLSIRNAEGGEAKVQLDKLIQDESKLSSLIEQVPTGADHEALRAIAKRRDEALARTAGPLMRSLFDAGRDVLANEAWTDKNKCPTCGHVHEHSVLDLMTDKLADYQAVDEATNQLISEWASKPWSGLTELEKRYTGEAETALFARTPVDSNHPPSEPQVIAFWDWTKLLADRANIEYLAQQEARAEIERTLPPSMVAATTTVEAARRLQTIWRELGEFESQLAATSQEKAKINRIKTFLDKAVTIFADAEAAASKRRLAAVEPLCQTFFDSIIHQPVKPALVKPGGGEELVLQLAQFFGLTDVSAQALLSESFRNAFAVSVYLAAASLYGGAPRFVVLDDVTSSFDAGHQFHLMEVIRTKFGRPGVPDGLQVILLSHDTLLEKLFNRNNGQPGWKHQRLEGTARTAVLPQSNAVNRVKDATIRFLGAGQVEDAAPRVRQYLEHVLLDVIHKVKIPVPIDFALDDQNKQVGAAMTAIDVAVKLHEAAGSLILDPTQRAGLQNYASSIMANFVSHYATGSTSAFSAASLLGVMRAIDDLADCFKHTDSSGTKRFYRSLSQR